MPRLLAFLISFFWMSAFAVAAMVVAGLMPVDGAAIPSSLGIWGPVFSIGFLLVATTFLWAFITAIFDGDGASRDVDWVVRIAMASAIFLIAAVLLVLAPGRPLEALAGALLTMAALGASAAAVEAECRFAQRKGDPGEVDTVAGRMAAGAAHSSMLSAISGRRSSGPGEL